jgi:hypothetical protein
MRNIVAIIASGAMLLSSAAASAAISRTSAPIAEQEEIAGNPWIPWVVALIAALVIVFVITDDDGEPESP